MKNLLSKWGLHPSNHPLPSGSRLKYGALALTPDVLNQNLHSNTSVRLKVRVPNAEVEALTFGVAVLGKGPLRKEGRLCEVRRLGH